MLSSDVQVCVTGMGVVSPVGVGLEAFSESLKTGTTNFSSITFSRGDKKFRYPIASVTDFNTKTHLFNLGVAPELISKLISLRNISVGTLYGLCSALEALNNSGIQEGTDFTRVAIVSSGSNTQQGSLLDVQQKYESKLKFLNPNYAIGFFDSDIVGALSELTGARGEGYSIGAASASGNMAIIQGCRLIKSKEYDVVIVVAPMMDISVFEYQGFTSLGAMLSLNEEEESYTYCPFDIRHNGFVSGQTAGCLILESSEHARRRGKESDGVIAGYGVCMDANRNPDPSLEGEVEAMRRALANAAISKEQIDYVNTHGSGSVVGDKTEVAAILQSGMKGVYANSTKSLTGHGLSSASLIEAIATIIQMRDKFLHGTNHLTNAISDEINWITKQSQPIDIEYSMSNGFGFGGINTSLIIKHNGL